MYALLSVDVRGDGFVFQYSAESGNHILRGLGERKAIRIIGSRSLHLVDAVFPEPVAGGTFRYPVAGGIVRVRFIQQDSLLHHLSQFIVVCEGRSHVLRLGMHEQSFTIVSVSSDHEFSLGIGSFFSGDLTKAVFQRP